MFSEIMRYILDLGPTMMLPIVIIIFSKLLGMKLGDCFKSGLHIGIGFVGIGLVIGGALGNVIDRLRFGAVFDFLDFYLGSYHWPAFNMADSSIFLGVCLLLWDGLFQGQERGKS